MFAHVSDQGGFPMESDDRLPGFESVGSGCGDGEGELTVGEGEPEAERAIRTKRDGVAGDGDRRAGIGAAVEDDFGIDAHPEVASRLRRWGGGTFPAGGRRVGGEGNGDRMGGWSGDFRSRFGQ